MTITQIIYALETARRRNISKAADALFVSQSALSQQLQKLEKELGYALFERTAHGLQITAEGMQFCEEAQPLIEHWEQFQKVVHADSAIKKRQVAELKALVTDIDPSAFIILQESHQVLGEGFKRYNKNDL